MSGQRGGVCAKHGPYPTQKRCPACNKEGRAAWVAANREAHNAHVKEYRGGRRDATRSRARAATQAIKTEAIEHYGGACVCCKMTELVFLTIDHPSGDGAAHRREIFGASIGGAGERFYRWLRRNGWPPGYRVLCWNCQHATTRGVCPHQLM